MPRAKMLLGALLLSASTTASAHVTVWPKESEPGSRERYDVRLPNEKQAETISLEVRFPFGMRVTSFEQKPGWMIEPLRDKSGAIIGVRWTGHLPPKQFTEFGLLAINPKTGEELTWPAIQGFADGSRIEWTGPRGSKTPAPRVSLKPK